jgi:hypothetical protein
MARLAPWLPTKCPATCPQHTLFFEKICPVVADSETWPNAADVRNGVLSKLAARHPFRPQVTAMPTFQEVRRITSGLSLALIGNASAAELDLSL